jgi:ppGpp synthetase/RelA/SpoT-type nucleotidyltranferase
VRLLPILILLLAQAWIPLASAEQATIPDVSREQVKACLLNHLEDVNARYADRLADRQAANGHVVAQSHETVNELYQDAVLSKPIFDRKLNGIGKSAGVEVVTSKLKAQGRSDKKIRSKLLGDPTALTDIVRGTIICDSMEQVRKVKAAITAWFPDYRFNDRFEKPKVNGYRDLQAVVLIEPRKRHGGINHWAEIQVQLRSLYDAKKKSGDSIYQRWRDLEEAGVHSPLSDEQKAEIVSLKAREKALYDQAYQSALH